ncbi:hypothetical protein [Acidicapsa ligni]|nr:hypothetical protein [Acidicapsa ligni]
MTTYIKPQLLNTKKASAIIMGSPKPIGHLDNHVPGSSVSSYRSDE